MEGPGLKGAGGHRARIALVEKSFRSVHSPQYLVHTGEGANLRDGEGAEGQGAGEGVRVRAARNTS